MKKLTKIVFAASLALSLCLVAIPAGAATNLVTNGGFELPEVTDTAKWQIFPSGTTDLGWTVDWYGGSTSYGNKNRPTPALKELHEGVNGWIVKEGDQYAELDTDWFGPSDPLNNEPASVKIYQNIATCKGGEYELTYAWSPRPNHSDNQLKVYWGGVEIASHSGAGGSNTNWTVEVKPNLVATGASTELAFVETGNPDSLGMFLDEVSVIQTKECPCPPPSCCGDIKITNKNMARVSNNVSVVANTGGNTAVGGNAVNFGGGQCEEHSMSVVSDDTNTVQGGGNAVPVTFIHSAWTASIPGATWIWGVDPVANPTIDEFSTFEKQFNVAGNVTSAVLDIASDNSYKVWVNGILIGEDASENNFSSSGQDQYTTPVANALHSGLNTIKIEVKNWALGGGTPTTNPAGLLYKLVVNSKECSSSVSNGGNVNGSIITGNARAKSKIVNVVNTNTTRIRR